MRPVSEINNISFSGEKKVKKTKNVKESFAAYGASAVAPIATLPVSLLAVNGMQKAGNALSADQVEIVKNSAEKMLQETGLAKKGVSINRIAPGASGFGDLLDEVFGKSKLMKSFLEMANPVYATENGKNAFFTDKAILGLCDANSVVLPESKLQLTAFHELGHALNYNMSKFGKMMQKMRAPGMAVAAYLAIFAAFSKESKPEEGQELGKGKKVKNFVRKHAGIFAFGAMMPTLIEEAMASVKGTKWANQNMAKDLAKKVGKTNAVAYVSYLAAAAGMALAAFAARKVKDSLVAKKEAKLANAQPVQK